MTSIITVHTHRGGGSTAEAVEPVWAFLVDEPGTAITITTTLQTVLDPTGSDWWVRVEDVYDVHAHDLPLHPTGVFDYAAIAKALIEYDPPGLKVAPTRTPPAPTPLEEPMTTDQERSELEVMLRFNVDANGTPLTPEGRSAMETRLGKPVQAEIRNTPDTSSPIIEAFPEAAPVKMALGEIESYEDLTALLAEILDNIDPRDSDTHLAVFKWLQERDRVQRLGTLNIPGTGYLYQYSEPKGSTKQGYVLGGSQGDRMVDNALEAVTAAGAQATKHGVCQHCGKIVTQEGEGPIATTSGNTVCEQSGTRVHVLA